MMSDPIEVSREQGFTTLTLQNGKANALNHEVFDALNGALDQAEIEQQVVVITGTPGILSGGYDLKVMQKSTQEAAALVEKGSRFARRLLAFPTPVIVACPGHAIAKAAFLLCAVDYRIGVEGAFKIGLNEVAIGMSIHHVGIELARSRLNSSHFIRSVNCAEMYAPDEALRAGFFDKIVSPDQFEQSVRQLAQAICKLDKQAHLKTKLKAREDLIAIIDAAIEKDIEEGL
jgi:enoyl-CoA hydratase